MPIRQALARVVRSKDLFRFLLRKLEPELIFDVGSRDGRDALGFREAVPSARIIACEGNPSLAEKMRGDAQLAAARIEVEHCAAGAAEGTGQFFVFNRQRGTGSLLPRVPGEGEVHAALTVPIRRLDALPGVHGAETIALWIDVEGCSYEVLEGARGLLPRVILIHIEVESHAFWKDQKLASEVQALLAEHGFAPVYERNKRGKGQANIIFLKREMAHRRDIARDIVRFEIRSGLGRLFGDRTMALRAGASPASTVLLSAMATLWWVCVHLPQVFLRYYGVLAVKRAYFALFLRQARERRLQSAVARTMIRDFRVAGLSIAPGFVDAESLAATNELLDRHGFREAVRMRKAEACGDPSRDHFHLSQEMLPRDLITQLLDKILPAEIQPVLELAHGRVLRCLKVTYHETNPSDPTVRIGDSLYNGHPFHIDGNPKFAKALLYLTNVDEDAGPFEMFRHSRFRLFDELLRLAYQERHFRGRLNGIACRLRHHLPAVLARATHLWDADLDVLQRHFPNALCRAVGPAGSFVFFNGMNLHNGSRDQTKRREVLHFIFV